MLSGFSIRPGMAEGSDDRLPVDTRASLVVLVARIEAYQVRIGALIGMKQAV